MKHRLVGNEQKKSVADHVIDLVTARTAAILQFNKDLVLSVSRLTAALHLLRRSW
jgi:hypothetical protein